MNYLIFLALVVEIYSAVSTPTNGNIYIIDRNEQKITHNFQFGALKVDNKISDTIISFEPKEELVASKLQIDTTL